MSTPITNAPKIIYLQDGGGDGEPLPSNLYDEQLTWCEDSIESNDTKYIRFDVHQAELQAARVEIERLRQEAAYFRDRLDSDQRYFEKFRHEREVFGAERQQYQARIDMLMKPHLDMAMLSIKPPPISMDNNLLDRAERAEQALADGGEWRAKLSEQCGKTLVAMGRAEKAEKSLAEAKADAERYRWLRTRINYRDKVRGTAASVIYKERVWSHMSYDFDADTIDAAIDAARAARSGA